MKNFFETGNPTVERIGRMQLSGYVIPRSWYRTIRKPNGKSNLAAVLILADLVYWCRKTEVREEQTGQIIGWENFQKDILQRDCRELADQFGMTKRAAMKAITELEQMGAIRQIPQAQEMNGQISPDVLFLELNVDVLKELTCPGRGLDAGKKVGE